MLWWLIVLTILVLYLIWCCIRVTRWLQVFYDAVIKHFEKCGCPQEEGWPPPKPPRWP